MWGRINKKTKGITYIVLLIGCFSVLYVCFFSVEDESNILPQTPTPELSPPSKSACYGEEMEAFQPSIRDYFGRDTSNFESNYFDWWNAAENGNEWAQCRMGDYCFTHNDCEALKWWLLSAEQGNIFAKYKLIKCYYLTSFEEWCKSHSFLHGLFF